MRHYSVSYPDPVCFDMTYRCEGQLQKILYSCNRGLIKYTGVSFPSGTCNLWGNVHMAKVIPALRYVYLLAFTLQYTVNLLYIQTIVITGYSLNRQYALGPNNG